MNSALVTTIYWFYAGTIVLNIVIAAFQYADDRLAVRKSVLLYWIAVLSAVMANTLVQDNGLRMVLIASAASFATQCILARVLADVFHHQPRWLAYIGSYTAGTMIGWALELSGTRFEVYATLILISSIAPVAASLLSVFKQHKRPFTLVQKMFLATAALMSMHSPDWAWMRTDVHLFIAGSIVAMVLVHILSILMPMLTVEYALDCKNAALEDEVEKRVAQLSDAREKLGEAEKFASLGRMAGGVAHEINTPLTIIGLNANRLRQEADIAPPSRDSVLRSLQAIDAAAERIANMTHALRKVALENVGGGRACLDLNAAARQALAARAERLENAHITIEFKANNLPTYIEGDPQEIQIVLSHLMDNAIDAVAELAVRWIRCDVYETISTCEFSISDSGSIDHEIIDRLMEPFVTGKPLGQGTGLGLSISRAIAERHGGSLVLDRTSSVTRFVFTLPKAKMRDP